MHLAHIHYLPIAPAFFSILVGILVVLIVLIQVQALRYAYMQLGISSGTAFLLLLGSLIGSYFNIPVAQLPEHVVMTGREITYFGMRYVVPTLVDQPGTTIAVNVGGALIPTAMSLYLLFRYRVWVPALLAVGCVAVVCKLIAQPVPGLGIALPVFVPAGVTTVVAWILSRYRAAQIAYIGGSMGTLIGADLLNLGSVQGLGAPIVSIGGAGTFDGIFLTGVLAVLLASFRRHPGPGHRSDGLGQHPTPHGKTQASH